MAGNPGRLFGRSKRWYKFKMTTPSSSREELQWQNDGNLVQLTGAIPPELAVALITAVVELDMRV